MGHQWLGGLSFALAVFVEVKTFGGGWRVRAARKSKDEARLVTSDYRFLAGLSQDEKQSSLVGPCRSRSMATSTNSIRAVLADTEKSSLSRRSTTIAVAGPVRDLGMGLGNRPA